MITTHKLFKLVIIPAVSICMVITGCAEHSGSVSPTPFTIAPSKTPDMTSPLSSFPVDPEPAATISIPSVTLLPWFSQEELNANANSNPYQSAYYGLGAPPRPGQPPDQIWVDAYECTPNVLTIKTGTTVTWVDFDVHDYTIISDDGLFAGEIIPSEFGFGFPGKQTFNYCFESPGAFTWTAPPDYCVSMGVIIVIA